MSAPQSPEHDSAAPYSSPNRALPEGHSPLHLVNFGLAILCAQIASQLLSYRAFPIPALAIEKWVLINQMNHDVTHRDRKTTQEMDEKR